MKHLKVNSFSIDYRLLPLIFGSLLLLLGCGLVDSSTAVDENESGASGLDPLPTALQPIATAALEADELSPRSDDGLTLPPTFTPPPPSEILTGPGPGVPSGSAGANTEPITVTLSGLTYTVTTGDTLGEIATEYEITVDQLVAANPELIENIDEIEVGWVLQIPESDS